MALPRGQNGTSKILRGLAPEIVGSKKFFINPPRL